MTTAEKAVQEALYELWYGYYTKPITQTRRNRLAWCFGRRWLDPTKIKINKPAYYHPMTRLKRRYDEPPITAAEILGDFVMRVDMHAERHAEYPVHNAENAITREDKRLANEIGLFSDDIDVEAGERVPYGMVAEADAIAQIYTSDKPISVEDFTLQLARVKKYADFYATSFAEEYGYEKKDALRRIKGLRLERIRECKVCGGAFYPKDLRREVCDQQHGVITANGGRSQSRSEKSACELIYAQNYQRDYYETTKLDLKKSIL